MHLAAYFRLAFRPSGRVMPYFTAAATFILPVARSSAQQLDTARALAALREAKSACEMDAGTLWRRSLCGSIALVDRQTRIVIANDTVGGRHFVRLGDAYLTTLPDNQYVANTSFQWAGRTWTMVALPLPRDRFARARRHARAHGRHKRRRGRLAERHRSVRRAPNDPACKGLLRRLPRRAPGSSRGSRP